MPMQRKYHGWIIVEEAGPIMKDHIYVEWQEPGFPERHRKHVGYGESGCATAVEWWDKRLGTPGATKLQPALKGSYRVYTEEKIQVAKEGV